MALLDKLFKKKPKAEDTEYGGQSEGRTPGPDYAQKNDNGAKNTPSSGINVDNVAIKNEGGNVPEAAISSYLTPSVQCEPIIPNISLPVASYIEKLSPEPIPVSKQKTPEILPFDDNSPELTKKEIEHTEGEKISKNNAVSEKRSAEPIVNTRINDQVTEKEQVVAKRPCDDSSPSITVEIKRGGSVSAQEVATYSKYLDLQDISEYLKLSYEMSSRIKGFQQFQLKISYLLLLRCMANDLTPNRIIFDKEVQDVFPDWSPETVQKFYDEESRRFRLMKFELEGRRREDTLRRSYGWLGARNDCSPMCSYLTSGTLIGKYWDAKSGAHTQYNCEKLRAKLPQLDANGYTLDELRYVVKNVHEVFYKNGITKDEMISDWDIHRGCVCFFSPKGHLQSSNNRKLPTLELGYMDAPDSKERQDFIQYNIPFVIDKVPESHLRPILEMAYDVSQEYEGCSSLDIKRVYEIILEKLANFENFSIKDLVSEVQDEFDEWPEDKCSQIASEELQRVRLKNRELSYAEIDGYEKMLFQWLGPIDRTSHPASRYLMTGKLRGVLIDANGDVSVYDYENMRPELPKWSSEGWTLSDLKSVVKAVHDVFAKHNLIKDVMLSDWDLHKGCKHSPVASLGPCSFFVEENIPYYEMISRPYLSFNSESLEMSKDKITLEPEFVKEKCKEILEVESPMTEEALFSRYCRYIGVKRITQKKREQLIPIIRDALEPEVEMTFSTYWYDNSDKEMKGFRHSQRDFDEIPLIEIQNAIIACIKSYDVTMTESLPVLLARAFRIDSLDKEESKRAFMALQMLIGSGKVKAIDGMVAGDHLKLAE